jgi:hypothetical protein
MVTLTKYKVHIAGNYAHDTVPHLYEKTTADQEIVWRRVLMKGTADNQLKLWADGNIPTAIGDLQTSRTPLVSGKPSSLHAQDGLDIDFIPIEEGVTVDLTIKDGQTIAKDGLCYVETLTGKIVSANVGDLPIGRAAQGAAPSGADGTIRVKLFKAEVVGV